VLFSAESERLKPKKPDPTRRKSRPALENVSKTSHEVVGATSSEGFSTLSLLIPSPCACPVCLSLAGGSCSDDLLTCLSNEPT